MRKSLYALLFILFSFPAFASSILIPMDAESQKNHLKAYGITYWVLSKQQKVQWLLNYRGGSFLLPDGENIRQECQIRGVSSKFYPTGRPRPFSTPSAAPPKSGSRHPGKSPQNRRIFPQRKSPLGRCGDYGADLCRDPLCYRLRRGSAGRQVGPLRLAAPAP